MSKFTKGNWNHINIGLSDFQQSAIVSKSENRVISHLYLPDNVINEEDKANAKLISSAPEMLEALIEIVNQWDKDIMAASYMMEVRELIKKITE